MSDHRQQYMNEIKKARLEKGNVGHAHEHNRPFTHEQLREFIIQHKVTKEAQKQIS
jgi:hypothetical protein